MREYKRGETCDEIRGDCDLSSAPLTLAETVMREINQGVGLNAHSLSLSMITVA